MIRYAPHRSLPPYAYVPGHGLPHPINDPAGHLHGMQHEELAVVPDSFATDPEWLYAIDLFNSGYYWEAHEGWEQFWNALGRTTPEARQVQGLIHLAAAAVKIREGKPEGVARHTRRARELLGDVKVSRVGDGEVPQQDLAADVSPLAVPAVFGLSQDSLATVMSELASYRPECWHTSRFPVVRVVVSELKIET
jgi:hypothetical protein